MTINFFVPGVAAPGGSKNAFVVNGKARLVDAGKNNKEWRQRVALAASQAMAGKPPLDGPCSVLMIFYRPRPKSHRTSKGKPSSKWRDLPTSKPDVLKLARAVEDAMSGIVYRDDCATVDLFVFKRYGDRPGVDVVVSTDVRRKVAE